MDRRKLECAAQTGVFLLFLGLPLLDSTLGLDRSLAPRAEVEARQPARPDTLASLVSFPDTFEPYFRENFGWRNGLINQFHRLNYRIFKVSETASVHVGREDWLFYGGTATGYQRANKPFNERQQRDWLDSIERRRQWLEAQGIEYLYVAAPNKHTIYPEYLPAKLRRSGEEGRWQVLSRLLEAQTDVRVVDLHTHLLAAKAREQVYERTGSHWNRRGAYIAYRAIFERLGDTFPHLVPVEWEQIEWKERVYPSDLVKLISTSDLVPEQRFKPVGGLRHTKLAFKRNRGLTTEQDDPSLPRAVIFHDSFGVTLAPYLAEHFSYAVFQWRGRFDGKVIQAVQPDIVIEERVERRLQWGSIPNDLPQLRDPP